MYDSCFSNSLIFLLNFSRELESFVGTAPKNWEFNRGDNDIEGEGLTKNSVGEFVKF